MLIVIYGPTGSGKTALSLDLAERFNGEVVSADSRQIFKGMDVGTGKIRVEEMRGIPHHCLDIANPDEDFSAVEWKVFAETAIADIRKRGKTPVICGGTGLYLDVLLFEFDVPAVPPDPTYRAELEAFRLKNGSLALWQRLAEKDPDYADEIHPNNYRYVERALEVVEKTGVSKAASRAERRLRSEYGDAVFTTPYDDSGREALYARINARVDAMFSGGLVEETRHILESYGPNAFALKTIGYAETAEHLKGNATLAETIELVKRKTRNYAKRQITWNTRYHELPHLLEKNLKTGVDF
jgi:tRNA dimethylallyltransferase